MKPAGPVGASLYAGLREVVKLRNHVEAIVAQLIDFLDDFEGDTDLEDVGDDEPSISGDDREADPADNPEGELDTSDTEASLGWTEAGQMGTPSGDGIEASLGSSHHVDQTYWASGANDCREVRAERRRKPPSERLDNISLKRGVMRQYNKIVRAKTAPVSIRNVGPMIFLGRVE